MPCPNHIPVQNLCGPIRGRRNGVPRLSPAEELRLVPVEQESKCCYCGMEKLTKRLEMLAIRINSYSDA